MCFSIIFANLFSFNIFLVKQFLAFKIRSRPFKFEWRVIVGVLFKVRGHPKRSRFVYFIGVPVEVVGISCFITVMCFNHDVYVA